MHGYEIHLEKATIQFEFAALADPNPPEISPLKVFTEDGQVLFPELSDGDPIHAFGREIGEVVDCLSKRQPSKILAANFASGRDRNL